MTTCPGCGESFERLGQHWQGDCGPYTHVEVCDDENCGICRSWRREREEQAQARMNFEDQLKTLKRKRREPEQSTLSDAP